MCSIVKHYARHQLGPVYNQHGTYEDVFRIMGAKWQRRIKGEHKSNTKKLQTQLKYQTNVKKEIKRLRERLKTAEYYLQEHKLYYDQLMVLKKQKRKESK